MILLWKCVHLNIIIFQLTIQAYDLGTPSGISENNARVTVRVARNFNVPRFQATPYKATLARNQGLDIPVIDVIASDDDKNVSSRARDDLI